MVSAFPNHNFAELAWVAIVPLMVVISGRSLLQAFCFSFCVGLFFFPGVFHWILNISGYTYLHHFFLAFYLSLYLGFYGLMFAFISKHQGITVALLIAPFLWVAAEFVRSNFFFLALPWALMAHTQYQHPLIIQIASLTGTYGISYLIVLVNSAFSAAALFLVGKFKYKPLSGLLVSGRDVILISCTAAFLVIAALFYGFISLNRFVVKDSVKVSVVQGNIDQVKKWDLKYRDFIMQTYSKLTQMASKDFPDLIVWPETATPSAINTDHGLYDQIKHISQSAGAYLLLGSAQYQKFSKDDGKNLNYMNSAFLISPNDKTENQRYDKIRLLPFGEYLPMERSVPWSFLGIPRIQGYIPGKKFTVFKMLSSRFGTTICWENIFPNLVRKFVKNGALFIVNITNEAWFGKTSAPYHFLAMSIFRAVENRVSVVRSANTGVSCFINPSGIVTGRVQNNDNDIFITGYLTKEVPLAGKKTFYTVYGDVFGYVSIGISILICFFTLLKSRQVRNI